MTVIVGLKLEHVTVVAADREENDTYLRNDIPKIHVQNVGSWTFSIAGTGTSAYIDFAEQKLRHRLSVLGPSLSGAQIKREIESEVLRIYEEHIFAANIPNPDQRPGFGMIIQAAQLDERLLFKTSDSLVTEIDQTGFACAGVGETFATSLLNKYFGGSSLYGAVLLALYVVMQTKKYICDVGGGTDISVQMKNRAIAMRAPLIVPIEALLDDLDDAFEGAFFSALSVENNMWSHHAVAFQSQVEATSKRLLDEMNRLFAAFGAND